MALQWFLNLDPSKKRWDDIGNAIADQCSFNIQLKVTTKELESTSMDPKENLTEFVNWWRAKVAMMVDRPSKKSKYE